MHVQLAKVPRCAFNILGVSATYFDTAPWDLGSFHCINIVHQGRHSFLKDPIVGSCPGKVQQDWLASP